MDGVCILWNKQYAEKSELSFNTRLNNHQKDVKKVNNNGSQTFSTRKL